MATDALADEAFFVFKSKRPELETTGDINEATTRLRVIDTILFDVLGWDKGDVEAEKWHRAVGYSDYVFGPASAMVLEAKRDGVSFVLPDRTYPDAPVRFSLLAKECPEAADALRQAQSYAAERGARYSAITNGRQWILSLTFVPGQFVEDRSVFVFESIDAIGEKFRLFYECFSTSAIATNLPNERLLDARRAPPPPKLSSKIVNYPVPADRNTLVNTLRRVLQLVWDEANFDTDSAIFLERCYIVPDPSEDMLRVARELLEQRSATDSFYRNAPIPASASILLTQKKLADEDALDREQPIVLLGRVGNGKSTFLKYLRHIAAKEVLDKDYIQIDIDFIDRPETAGHVPTFILDAVEHQLKKTYQIEIDSDPFVRSALRRQLKEFHATPRGKLLATPGREQELANAEVDYLESFTKDRAKYLQYVMRHIRGSYGKSIAIFFDNLDRQKDDIQEQAFLRASAIAADWTALVFVCLRPSTVQKSVARGVLDTIAPRMIFVSPPKTAPMLRKRFQYAAQFASKALPPTAYVRASFTPETEESMPRAVELFEACDQSILRKPHIAQQYESVANGNVRLIIRYVRDTLTSNHLNTEKLTSRNYQPGEFELKENETLRALIFGPYTHYEPNSSLFANLFDINRADKSEHFSRLLLLEFCHRFAHSVDQYGFTPIDGIHAYMASLGYSAHHVSEVIDLLFAKKYLEGRDHDEETPTLGDQVRITSLGRYHVSTLVRKFDYLDAVVVDTPILDEKIRAKMSDARAMDQRTYRAREFLRYLDQASESLLDLEAKRVWSDISIALASNITDVENATKGR